MRGPQRCAMLGPWPSRRPYARARPCHSARVFSFANVKRVRVAAGYRPFRPLRVLASIRAPPKSNCREPRPQYLRNPPSAILPPSALRPASSLALEQNAREAVFRPLDAQAWLSASGANPADDRRAILSPALLAAQM